MISDGHRQGFAEIPKKKFFATDLGVVPGHAFVKVSMSKLTYRTNHDLHLSFEAAELNGALSFTGYSNIWSTYFSSALGSSTVVTPLRLMTGYTAY